MTFDMTYIQPPPLIMTGVVCVIVTTLLSCFLGFCEAAEIGNQLAKVV